MADLAVAVAEQASARADAALGRELVVEERSRPMSPAEMRAIADAPITDEIPEDDYEPSGLPQVREAGEAELSRTEIDAVLAELPVEEGDELISTWGRETGRNLAVIQQFMMGRPDLEAAVADAPISAGLLKAALILAREWRFIQPDDGRNDMKNFPSGSGYDREILRLTAEQQEAQEMGDYLEVQRLDRQIFALAARLSGDEPIDGSYDPTM